MKKRKKIFVKLIRNTETIKTVAIVLLMVSCVYFGLLVFQYQAMPDSRNLSFSVWNNFEYMYGNSKSAELNADKREIMSNISSPIYIVSDNANGREIFNCDDEEYTELCDIIDNYIFSVYSGESKATAERIEEDSEWIADMNSKFIYAKLPVSIGPMFISGTEYEGNMISKSIAGYDEIIMTSDAEGMKYGNSTVIYLGSSETAEKLRIILDRSPLAMLEAIDSKTYGAEKDVAFAFELEDAEFSDYAVINKLNKMKAEGKLYINPMLIVPLSTIDTHTILVSDFEDYRDRISSEDNSRLVSDILNAFEYAENNERQYRDNDGDMIFVDGPKTLELTTDGIISYTDSEAKSRGKKSVIDGISDLYKKLYGVVSAVYDDEIISGKDIILTDINSYVEQNEERNIITELSFDYEMDGRTVRYESEDGTEMLHFINAKLCNGVLQSLDICVREMTLSDELSPNESAFTALERYIDSKSAEDGVIMISDMRLEYVCSPSSSKSHTKWVVLAP